jgi:hypothetical protein
VITAAMQLQPYGVSLQAAHDWVFANLQDPSLILQVAAQYGVTNGMLAEIAGDGIDAQQVRDFFAGYGIDSTALDAGAMRLPALPAAIPQLAEYAAMDTASDVLAVDALREEVQSLTGKLEYWELFSPNWIFGAFDGVLTPQELGTDGVGMLQATPQALESLFYGTMIGALGAFDRDELAGISDYVSKWSEELKAGDKEVQAGYEQLVADALQTASQASISDAEIASLIVDATASAVQLVGSGAEYELLVPLLKFG